MPKARQEKSPGTLNYPRVLIEASHFQDLFDAISSKGYDIIGPTVHHNTVVYDQITSAAELPVGYTDEQDGGTYRLHKTDKETFFGYTHSPQSWKRFLYPSAIRLWQTKRQGTGFQIDAGREKAPKQAFIGVRACELAAIGIQDRVLTSGPYTDSIYQSRRENVLIVAVNCGHAGGTCFCASMDAGPKVTKDFDLALTEILDDHRHIFVVEIGSALGKKIIQTVPSMEVTEQDKQAADQIVAETAQHMGRHLDTPGVHDLLNRNSEHPRWDNVASRCLSCANCTMVCPTCFCTTIEDVTDLSGKHAERVRKWDSCFTLDFSYIHGGSVRTSTKARYRQWLTHKFASWIDQFGTEGCVGCGRCITWCPVGIDLTQEIEAIRDSSLVTAEK